MIERVKSRYCVKCDAMFKFECKCPNHKRMHNIKKTFHKISTEKIVMAFSDVGIHKG